MSNFTNVHKFIIKLLVCELETCIWIWKMSKAKILNNASLSNVGCVSVLEFLILMFILQHKKATALYSTRACLMRLRRCFAHANTPRAHAGCLVSFSSITVLQACFKRAEQILKIYFGFRSIGGRWIIKQIPACILFKSGHCCLVNLPQRHPPLLSQR